jgi:hypothetical protein
VLNIGDYVRYDMSQVSLIHLDLEGLGIILDNRNGIRTVKWLIPPKLALVNYSFLNSTSSTYTHVPQVLQQVDELEATLLLLGYTCA